ncbi:MAG: class A beta-lactamase [Planctomycetes bacterium]|nr:class A beta-lactamase [Planctomycetota bacterium]
MHEPRVDRRTFLWVASGTALASCRSTASAPLGDEVEMELAALERARGGRLGVAVLDTGRGTVRGHRLDERFALCSTFKLVLAAMVLDRAARGEGSLDERLRIAPADLIAHATVTKAAVDAAFARGATAGEATRRELAEAMQTRSDGTASNLLLRDLGGLGAFAAFCRAHGDLVTRLDRLEPEMNDVRPGDERDTTTPRAMAQLVARLFADGGIAPVARQTLWRWMVATGTGVARVRAGLPPAWPAGDKTGTGGGVGVTVKCNDVVRIEPPGHAPLVVAVYYDTGVVAEWPSDADEAVLAEVGRIVAGRFRSPAG